MGKRAFSPGKRFVTSLLVAGAAIVVPAFATPQAGAAGATFYASPNADPGGTCLSSASPCRINEAVAKAGDGDSVSLAGGVYDLPFGGITLEKAVDFGAARGAPAVLVTTVPSSLKVTPKAGARLHDIRLEGEGVLLLGSGVADRVFVAYQGVLENACELQKGTTLRDSVCWTREVNDEEVGVSHALEISSSGENQDLPVILRNVTAFAETDQGSAIHLLATAGAELAVDAANVIARSVNGTDIVAEATIGGFSKAHLNITNSSFGEFADDPPDAAVTPLGTAGNIAAAPTFLHAAVGDFHVGGDSPTLDGGVRDAAVGVADLDGNDRSQAGCFGANPVPDMGAYERTPTAACPPPPPPPPAPFEARKPVFRIINLFLNKKKGTGRLQVEVPGAGTLSLTGSGVKLVRRTAPAGGGVITLPIQTWAITKVRLAKRGRTKVRLKVIFEPRGGSVEEWSKGVLLRKKVS